MPAVYFGGGAEWPRFSRASVFASRAFCVLKSDIVTPRGRHHGRQGFGGANTFVGQGSSCQGLGINPFSQMQWVRKQWCLYLLRDYVQDTTDMCWPCLVYRCATARNAFTGCPYFKHQWQDQHSQTALKCECSCECAANCTLASCDAWWSAKA